MAGLLGKLRRVGKQKSVVDAPSPSTLTTNLAYCLDSLLTDAGALQYFIQYLDSCGKIALIQFWMRVEGFRSSASSEIQESAISDDAKSIYAAFIAEDAPSPIHLPAKLKEIIHNRLSAQTSAECFTDAVYFVRQLFELRYFEEFKSSVYYKKHELEVLQSECSLFDILHIQSLLLSFIELLEDEDKPRLQFLIAVDSYETEFYFISPEQAQTDAMVIYDTYFSMQARCPLRITAEERTLIETGICGESGASSRTAFGSQKEKICFSLSQRYLSVFLASQCVADYILELKTQIEKWVVDVPPRSRLASRTSSTSSVHSEVSESKRLLNEVTKPLKKTHLAEVDSMGRYRPLFEGGVVQGSSSPRRLKLRLRRYLNGSSMVDDEIAEEVARSIIDDVQKMVEQGKRASNGFC